MASMNRVLAYHFGRIYNDQKGNDVASAHELPKAYTLSLDGSFYFFILFMSYHHADRISVCKLNNVLNSKSISDKHVKAGNFVEVH